MFPAGSTFLLFPEDFQSYIESACATTAREPRSLKDWLTNWSLAGVLSVAANKKSPSSTDGLVSQVEMVAGTCSQRYLHLAKARIQLVSSSAPAKFSRL